MELTVALTITGVFSLALFCLMTHICLSLLKAQATERETSQENLKLILQTNQETLNQTAEKFQVVLSKTVSLLSVKDPLSFQQVQMMDSGSTLSDPVDNSDGGELLQWVDSNDELTPAEKELYREINPNI